MKTLKGLAPEWLALLTPGTWIGAAYGATQASTLVWNSGPAREIFYDAVMVGNCRLGATINGYTDKELIWLNEESIWSGGPEDRINRAALASTPLLREQMLDGDLSAASKNWLTNFTATPSSL